MAERQRQTANNLEPQRLPESHGTFVRADDEVKLHCAIASRPRVFQRMLAHSASHSSSGGRITRYVAAVADMPSSSGLVRSHVVGAEDDAVLFSDECFLVRSQPVSHRFDFAHVGIER